jgi:hypothetical protein
MIETNAHPVIGVKAALRQVIAEAAPGIGQQAEIGLEQHGRE